MTRFRPCIDLHAGQVKQIVGGTLTDSKDGDGSNAVTTGAAALQTNHISSHSADYFARLYRDSKPACTGAHVIKLGPGNDEVAREALAAWPGGLQLGGGINADNAADWIAAGAEKVIITSYLFPDASFSQSRLDAVLATLGGDRSKLVIDLSCRRQQGSDGKPRWVVAMNKWQTLTDMEVNADSIRRLEPYCSEFLVHAADVEGLQAGVDADLVRSLAEWCSLPVTYAGGARGGTASLLEVDQLSGGRVDLTIGSALDIFGGSGARFADCVQWNSAR